MNSIMKWENDEAKKTVFHLAASSAQEQVTKPLSTIVNIQTARFQNPKQEVCTNINGEENVNLSRIITVSIPQSLSESNPSSDWKKNRINSRPFINPWLTILAIISGFTFFYTAVIDPPLTEETGTARFIGAGVSLELDVHFLFVFVNFLGFLLSWAIVLASATVISHRRRAMPALVILAAILGVYVFAVFSNMRDSYRPTFGLVFVAAVISGSVSGIARWCHECREKVSIT